MEKHKLLITLDIEKAKTATCSWSKQKKQIVFLEGLGVFLDSGLADLE